VAIGWSLIRALQPIATQVYNFGPASLTANGTIAVSEGRVADRQFKVGLVAEAGRRC